MTDTATDTATDDTEVEREPEEQVRRMERLRINLLAVDPASLRRALKGLPAPVLDSVAKAVNVRPPVLRAGSPKPLKRLHDALMLDAVASAVTDDCLEAIRERLGDEADDPAPESVRRVVDEVTDTEFPVAMVRLTLSVVAAGHAEASDTCNELLDTDERFATPDEADLEAPPATVVATAAPTARKADAEKKAARQARRAAEAERKRQQAEAKAAADAARKAARKAATTAGNGADEDDVVEEEQAALPSPAELAASLTIEAPAPPPAPKTTPKVPLKASKPTSARSSGPVPQPKAPSAPVSRRPAGLLGDDARDFNDDDPLVGSIVIAEIWFDSDEYQGLEAKRRPCVIVGVNDKQFLVRPGYSEGGRKARDWQSYEIGDWREAGLDKLTYIEVDTRRIDKAQAELPPLGKLTVLDWNALW